MGYGGGRRYGYNRYPRKVFFGAICPDNKKSTNSKDFPVPEFLLLIFLLIPVFMCMISSMFK